VVSDISIDVRGGAAAGGTSEEGILKVDLRVTGWMG